MPDRTTVGATVIQDVASGAYVIAQPDRGEWLLAIHAVDGRRVLGIRWDGTYDFGEAPDPGLAGRTFVEAMLPYLAGAGLIPTV